MKKILIRIIKNPILILIIMLKDLIDAGKLIIKIQPIINFDWWDFIIKLIIAIFLWYLIKLFFELKSDIENLKTKIEFETKASAILDYVRIRRSFIKSYKEVEFFRLPNETEKNLWNRLPEGGLLKQELLEEYEEAKTLILNDIKNKTSQEIDDFLKPFFPDQIFQ